MRACVIGGGLVGLATARAIARRHPSWRIRVLEKEGGVGRHQSTHNSGVLHCGLYYRPGSLKARMAVEGIRSMLAFCEAHGVAHERCGKLVVAAGEEEVPRLEELMRRGRANGLGGLRRLDARQMREIEPHVGGVAAAHVPEEGIVDFSGVCGALAGEVAGAGGEIVTSAKVTSIRQRAGEWRVGSSAGEFAADWIVNCAGLHSDRVARLAGEEPATRIVPFRGGYHKLRADRVGLVRHLIYPVPDPAFPFLGVHFTRMIGGGVEAGPSAVLAFAREGYRLWDVNVRDLAEALAFPGLWRFLRRYPSMVREELWQAMSREAFCGRLRRLIPELRPGDLEPGPSGVRAQAMGPDGSLAQDFEIVGRDHALHVLNAPSPAATACLAIGEHVAAAVGP